MGDQYAEQVLLVKDILPDVPEHVILGELRKLDGNLERVIEGLIGWEETAKVAGEADEELARKLQDEEYMDTSSFVPVSHYEYGEDDQTHVGWGGLDETMVGQFLENIKGSVIPVLILHLKNLEVPPMNEKVQNGTIGAINFGIEGVTVSDVQIPQERVSVKTENQEVVLVAQGVSAELAPFRWFYEKDTFPKLKDSGTANAAISNTTINVSIQLGATSQLASKCTVEIGNLDIKIRDTKASFLYNVLLASFKSSICRALQNTLAQAITSTINSQTSGLLSAVNSDI